MLVFFVAGALGNTPLPHAAFTTVNPDYDVGDHCANGNPAVNCNIYDGKEFVWLNGGPVQAQLDNGNYVFAVLVPGGQGGNENPNDGTPLNLSDPSGGDVWTNRVFTVTDHVISYSGTHVFDHNKIRLIPYDDTTNPGGVYIMAICSLADSTADPADDTTWGPNPPGVDPSDCKYDAFKVNSDNTTPPAADPTVSKDATGSYDTKWTWGITKSVDKTSVTLNGGGTATFNYTVSVTHNAGANSGINVTGNITIANPNAAGDDITVNVSDTLSNNTSCTIKDGSTTLTSTTDVTVPGAGTKALTYSCTIGGTSVPNDLKNTVTVSWGAQLLDSGAFLATGTASFTYPDDATYIGFTQTKIDDCVNVTDTFKGTLGTLCNTDASPTEFKYSRTVSFDPTKVPSCLNYDNTATFTTDDTATTGSAGQTVSVCVYGSRFTPGYWRNHLAPIGSVVPGYSTNCKSNQGCSSNGPYTITGLPVSLGTYSVDTITKVVSVFDKMNCNNLTTANNALGCLAGHLLAAKLNRKLNNSNPCIDATIAAADAFLIARSYVGPTSSYTLTAAQRATAITLKSALDAYNNGGGC
jgi:hypothetical protein